MNKELLITAAIIAAVAGLLIIGGCSKQTRQPEAQSPQQQLQMPEQVQPQPAPAAEAGAPQQPPEDDLYKDNLDGALDYLSQLE